MEEDITKLQITLEKLKINLHYLDVLMANDIIQDNDIDELQLHAEKLLLDVEVLGARLDVKETENSEISISVGNLESGLTDLTTQYNNSLASITHNQETFVDDLEASASLVTELTSILADESGRIDGQAILVQDLSTTVIRTEAGVIANAKSTTELSVEVDNVSADLLDTQETVATNELATASSITALESDITSLNGLSASNSTALISLGTRTQDTEDGLIATSESITALTSTVGTNTSTISSEVTTRASETSALTTSVDALNASVGALSASFDEEVILRTDGDSVNASSITSLTTSVGTNSATISTVSSSVDGMAASYGVTIDINGHASGFGLLAQSPEYTPPTEDPTIPAVGSGLSKFWVRADTFSIINPLHDSVHPPFEVKDGDVFIKDAYIEDASITNAKIGNYIESSSWDAINRQGWHINKDGSAFFNDITITDATGNIILSSGTGLSGVDWDSILDPNNTKPDNNASYGASFGVNISGQITAGNISTYIAGLAVGTAYIGDAAITTAKIGDLQVETLKIKDNAVTIPSAVTLHNVGQLFGVFNYTNVINLTVYNPHNTSVDFVINFSWFAILYRNGGSSINPALGYAAIYVEGAKIVGDLYQRTFNSSAGMSGSISTVISIPANTYKLCEGRFGTDGWSAGIEYSARTLVSIGLQK